MKETNKKRYTQRSVNKNIKRKLKISERRRMGSTMEGIAYETETCVAARTRCLRWNFNTTEICDNT